MSKLGTFVALGVRGSRMIDNCSFNLGEFYVKMGKTNRNLYSYLIYDINPNTNNATIQKKPKNNTIVFLPSFFTLSSVILIAFVFKKAISKKVTHI